jgi:hypothetical protein
MISDKGLNPFYSEFYFIRNPVIRVLCTCILDGFKIRSFKTVRIWRRVWFNRYGDWAMVDDRVTWVLFLVGVTYFHLFHNVRTHFASIRLRIQTHHKYDFRLLPQC